MKLLRHILIDTLLMECEFSIFYNKNNKNIFFFDCFLMEYLIKHKQEKIKNYFLAQIFEIDSIFQLFV